MPRTLKPFLALTVSLFALNVLGPAALLLPVSFCFFYRKLSLQQMALAALTVIPLLILYTNVPVARYVSLVHHIVTSTGFLVFLGIQTHRGADEHQAIRWGLLTVALLSLLLTAVYGVWMHTPLSADMLAFIRKENVALSEPMTIAMEQMGHLIPGLIAASQMVIFVFNLFLFQRITGTILHFRTFELPFWAVPAFVVTGCGYILSGVWPVLPQPTSLWTANLLLALTALFFVLGLSVAVFFIERANIPRIGKLLLYALLLFQPGPLLIILIGFAEPWLEIRKRFPIIKS